MARCLAMAGVEPGMVLHNAFGYGLFTGGLGFHQGAELLGCAVVPVSGGMTQRQAMLLHDLGGQVLCATPSYALNIAEALAAAGIDRGSLKLRVGIFGAEPWTEELRDELERRLGLRAINVYGLSEIVGPGVAAECAEGRNGLAHPGRPLPARDRRPRDGRAAAAGSGGRVGPNHPDQGGAAAHPLPHRRHLRARHHALRLRADIDPA